MEPTQVAGHRHTANRHREPAESHFRKLNGPAAPRRADGSAMAEALPCESAEKVPYKFDIYRADEVRMTSTQFCGGDWHWRLSDAEGLILLDTGGYASEHECRSAVAILQENAGWASLSPTS